VCAVATRDWLIPSFASQIEITYFDYSVVLKDNSEDGDVYQIGQGGVPKTQTFLNQALGAAYMRIRRRSGSADAETRFTRWRVALEARALRRRDRLMCTARWRATKGPAPSDQLGPERPPQFYLGAHNRQQSPPGAENGGGAEITQLT
jgi:hypothetical protein